MNGLLLPAILVCMLLLAGRRALMGDLALSRGYLILCWAVCGVLTALDIVLLASTFAQR